jgi:hypothetical protein
MPGFLLDEIELGRRAAMVLDQENTDWPWQIYDLLPEGERP